MSLKDRLNSQPKISDNELEKEKLQESIKKVKTAPAEPEGFGVLNTFFADSTLNSIYIASAKNVYIEKRGITHKSTTTFRDNVQLINIIKRNALDSGIEIDENTPYMKFNYRKGVNIKAILPPLSDVPVMYIKNFCDENADIKIFQDNRSVSKELAMILEAFAGKKLNILVAGAPDSLKTTMLSAIAKLLPINCRGVAIDFKNEMAINSDNFVNYDFLNLKDDEIREEILDSIFNSNPDKVVVNDCDEKVFYEIIKHASFGFKGILTSINASDTENAVNNLAQIILKNSPSMSFENAKRSVCKAFDIIILVTKDENGFRAVSKISETDFNEAKTNDIFYLNENGEHSSTGFVPKFYTLSHSLSINPNIFDENYKHTYSKFTPGNFQPSDEIIKKIKENSAPESTPSLNFESISKSLSSDEMLKRAQEKFEELRRNTNSSEARNEEPPQDSCNNNSEFNPDE